jgi:hypothetical protein
LDFVILSSKDTNKSLSPNNYTFNDFSSLVKIENFILRSNDELDWILFSCGNQYFREVIFVTQYEFVNKFIEQNIADIKLEINLQKHSVKIPEIISANRDCQNLITKFTTTNILMSEYLVDGSLGSSLSGVIFDRLYAPFDRLMKCCNISLNDILLVSDMVPYESDVSSRTIILPINRYSVLTSEYHLQEQELFLMEFDSIKYFKEVCSRLSASQADIMLIIPKNTNVDLFRSLLLKAHEIGADPFSGDEWMYLSDLKDTMEWFYGIERVYLHDECSIFISANSDYITAFDRLNIDDGYKLIGCF